MVGRVAVLGIAAAALVALYFSGFFSLVQDIDASRAALRGLGPWAPILYVLTFCMIQPIFFPAAAIILTGSVLWGYSELLLLSWLGATGAGIVGFAFARYIGRDFVEDRMPERLRRYDERLEDRGLRTVIIVRLLFFISPPATWLLGLSRVHFGKFVIGTAIGLLPGMAGLTWLVSVVGGTLVAWLASQPNQVWFSLLVIVVVLIVLRRFMARRGQGATASDEDDVSSPGD